MVRFMYTENELVRIAKREHNTRRNYLVVNPLQGKHIPVKPSRALDMFRRLADIIRREYKNEKLLLIGFAETAAAIGAAAAVETGALYMQTTREVIPGAEYLYFTEAHSHATEQKLVKQDLDRAVSIIDRIIFIEDELTTGNTILNIVSLIEKVYNRRIPFSAASLLNGMDEDAVKAYQERGIRLHYLVKTDHRHYAEAADAFSEDGEYVPCNTQDAAVTEIQIGYWMDARRLTDSKQYQQACEYLWKETAHRLSDRPAGNVLVLGTEEFMYPALYAAHQIECSGADAVFHATTRSPIAVSGRQDYPLHARYELRSMYDRDRVTYVYDIGTYDMALIFTDAQDSGTDGIYSLVHALQHKDKNNNKNEKIYLIRWVRSEKFL